LLILLCIPSEYYRLSLVQFLDHGGMHLYDCVTEQPDVTLAEAGLVTEMHLFLWDGESVSSRRVEGPSPVRWCEVLVGSVEVFIAAQ